MTAHVKDRLAAAGFDVVPYHASAPIQQWLCSDTVTELRGTSIRIIQTRPRPAGVALTWTDGMAGAGGATDGISTVPGNVVTMVINHWPLAVETHNHNFPHADHDVANVARVDPRRYPTTDCMWISPECTKWSIAQGLPCDFDTDWEQPSLFEDEDDNPADKAARWRSRLLMTDVIRFARVHHYKAIIVENVTDILKWHNFPRFLSEMAGEGYDYKVLILNAAFAGALGAPAPQLRDRVFIVFWKKEYRRPDFDKWLRPKGWCPTCEQVVDGLFTEKPSEDVGQWRAMRYDAQYFYRCPNHARRDQVRVQPYVLPALAAVDITKQGQRIGDRKRPLAQKTADRIRAGIARIISRERAAEATETRPTAGVAPFMLVPTGGTWRDSAASVDVPMASRTTRENDALVGASMIVPTEGRAGLRTRTLDQPLRTQTGRHLDALVVPLRNNGIARPVNEHPLVTFAAGGQHQALVMRNNNVNGNPGFLSTPAGEPMRTLTTAGHQSLVTIGDPALYSYDTGLMRPLLQPLPTQTSIDGDALLHTAIDIDDATLRMLELIEIQAGMAFDKDYAWLGGAKRDKVRMLGNAVAPPCSRDLVACVYEAITGDTIELRAAA